MYVLGLDNSVSTDNLGGCAKKRSKAGRFDNSKDHSSKKSVNTYNRSLSENGKKFKFHKEKKRKGTIYERKGISLKKSI